MKEMCVRYLSNLVEKCEGTLSKPWIKQDMISKIDE
jgi:hypothetical protein